MDNKEKIKEAIYKTVRKPVVLIKGLDIINEPKRELLDEVLKKLNINGKVLIIVDDITVKNSNLKAAVEQSNDVEMVLVSKMTSKDVLAVDNLVITEAAMKDVSERLSKL